MYVRDTIKGFSHNCMRDRGADGWLRSLPAWLGDSLLGLTRRASLGSLPTPASEEWTVQQEKWQPTSLSYNRERHIPLTCLQTHGVKIFSFMVLSAPACMPGQQHSC